MKLDFVIAVKLASFVHP